MTIPDELDYDRAAARIGRSMAVIAALGTIVSFAVRGWAWGAGFFLGSVVSGLNYHWLRRLVESLGDERPHRRRGVAVALRYLCLGAGGYVIVKYSSVSLPAVLTGLFVLMAAVIVEVIFEIIYARK